MMVEDILMCIRNSYRFAVKTLVEKNNLVYYMIFTTVSICGAYFLIVVSTPAFSVI
ncbi:hypothetical protein FLCH110379_11150 [Flavobacterium chungbukense]